MPQRKNELQKTTKMESLIILKANLRKERIENELYRSGQNLLNLIVKVKDLLTKRN